MIINTPRLILRPFTEDDALKTYLYSQEPSRALGIPNEVYESEAEALGVLRYLIGCYNPPALPFVLAIELRGEGYIGHVGISEIAVGVEIGYAVCEAARGNGYAAEAVKAFTPRAIEAFGLNVLYGEVLKSNAASKRVMEKAGYAFVPEGNEGWYAPSAEYDVYRYVSV